MLLDLALIQPGDILLTHGIGVRAKLLASVQRLVHLKFTGPAFTHATIFVGPFLRFDTVPGAGARFNRIGPTLLSHEDGRLRLWWEVPNVTEGVVIRYPATANPDLVQMLDAAVVFNTERYPGLRGFAPLFRHLRQLASRVGMGENFTYDPECEKFCSALVAEVHRRLSAGAAHTQKSPGELSPLLLYERELEVPGLTAQRKDVIALTGPGAEHYLYLAQLVGGGEQLNHFMHGIENVQASFNRMMNALRSNASPEVEALIDESRSLMGDPRHTQYRELLEALRSGTELLNDLRALALCNEKCSMKCSSATECFAVSAARFERLLSTPAE